MLEVKNISKTFNPGTVNEKQALRGLSLTLNDGDFVTVIGGNGAGKSTLLNAIAGTWKVDEGQIIIDGVDVTKYPEHKRAAFLGRVFQDPMNGTAATMGIEENLALALRRGDKRTLKKGIMSAERRLYRDMLAKLGLGLENRLTSKVGLLSGGQRQALTLLMATLKKPKLLLLDEHTAGPQDGCQGSGDHGEYCQPGSSDHPDDHPQYEGRHPHREQADYDEQRADHLRCGRRGEEESAGGGSAEEVRRGQRGGICQ